MAKVILAPGKDDKFLLYEHLDPGEKKNLK